MEDQSDFMIFDIPRWDYGVQDYVYIVETQKRQVLS